MMSHIKIPLIDKRLRISAIVVIVVAILYYSTVGTPPGSVAGSGGGGNSGVNVLLATDHALAYALLAWSVAYAKATPPASDTVPWKEAVLIIGGVTVYGFSVELLQLWFPERFFDPVDIVSNAVGAVTVLGWYLLEPYMKFFEIGLGTNSE